MTPNRQLPRAPSGTQRASLSRLESGAAACSSCLRRWWNRAGSAFPARLRRSWPRPSSGEGGNAALYRAFLQVTNGWRWPEPLLLLPSEQVDLYQTKDPEQAQGLAELPVGQDGADLLEVAHRVYGDDQDPMYFRGAYVHTALQIIEAVTGFGYEVYLLNLEVVSLEGEWEAWLVSTKNLGSFAGRPSGRCCGRSSPAS